VKRTINFNAGPAVLPLPALERAQRELLDFEGSGMSVMEHSHRGKQYEAVHNEAIALLRELLVVPETYEVLFLQGGASQQFAEVPLNFLTKDRSADYILTGAWGEKAYSEAKVVAQMVGGHVRLAASTGVGEGKEKQYTRVPSQGELSVDAGAAYLHYTSNETIHGVEFFDFAFPGAGSVPLVCDMSSDFLWRPFDVSRFALIYAGAQKNVGPSGLAVVLVRKDFLATARTDIPKIFQYRVHAENNSLYNTPPTFGIYLVRNVLAWIKASGGLGQIEAWNRKKAALLYGAIDRYPNLYHCPVEPQSRSVMNVVFRLPNAELEEAFLAAAKKADMAGLKGHRSVGGIRVSLYNAVSVEWVEALVGMMDEFARARRA
jgi:phosphoserine aminotransferase